MSNKKENGKLYQVKTLPKGKYKFMIDVAESFFNKGRFTVRFLVAKGNNTFPDYVKEVAGENGKVWEYNDPEKIVLVDKLLSDLRITIGSTPVQVETNEINLSETTEVTIGFLTMTNDQAGVKVSAIKTIWLGE